MKKLIIFLLSWIGLSYLIYNTTPKTYTQKWIVRVEFVYPIPSHDYITIFIGQGENDYPKDIDIKYIDGIPVFAGISGVRHVTAVKLLDSQQNLFSDIIYSILMALLLLVMVMLFILIVI